MVCGIKIKMKKISVIGSLVGSFLLKPTLEGNAEEWEGKLFQGRNLNSNINIVSYTVTYDKYQPVMSYSIFLTRMDPTH